MTGSSYQVELFDSPPPRSEWDRLDTGHRRLVESLIAGFNFNALGRGLAPDTIVWAAAGRALESLPASASYRDLKIAS